ncbi:MAG: xylono-1,5-lactonase [Alphaproteobacteria bacterium]|nr:xylono-1,5-lactonase [Alphaproteobacteria bacterium]
MKTLQLETLAEDFAFLEGPRWRDGKLWVSDVFGKVIYTVTPDGARSKVLDVPEGPSGIGFLPDKTPVIVSMEDRCLYKIINGKLVLHADISKLVNSNINDMVIDARGNAYVGNLGYDLFGGAEMKLTNFILVTPDGKAREVANGLAVPNGPVITPDGKTLILAESMGRRLTAFDIQPDGALSNRRVFADLAGAEPDGICLDAEGAVWFAAINRRGFLRVKEGGEITHKIETGKRMAIACTLGGADGRTFYGLTYEGAFRDISKGGRNSRIETVRVDAGASGSP